MSRRERGGATIFVLSMSLVLMLCAGLVIDGGMGINARMRVADDAEQAARAGANAVNVDQLRSGGALAVDPGLARMYAQDFLSARGYPAAQFSITVNANTVAIEVRDTSDTTLLKLIGINEYPVTARATATAATS
ncbi:MAG: Tad domain-containing protein [Aeromicrobium sp.]